MRQALRTDPMTLPPIAARLLDGAVRPAVPLASPTPTPAVPVQAVLNVVDPTRGQVFEQGAIEVDAVLEWEHDGPETLRTTALRWCEYAVFVIVEDTRFVGVGVWLSAAQVAEVR